MSAISPEVFSWVMKRRETVRSFLRWYPSSWPAVRIFKGLEYLICDLWDDGVPVCLYGFSSPLWKGDAVQPFGKPIISSTNRGDSWEVLPVAARTRLVMLS